ncbi:hypothetical protein AVEN_40456-1 [Araneus ventricosus]|uniref:Uncharacterized protein n=1 Tax=Araneus ventricosus TaxID=182803 RepID=A0A4Y2PE11_ARAVE|nr:hypothetical protein AVEN_40456-1 [Araneus ventricosus]
MAKHGMLSANAAKGVNCDKDIMTLKLFTVDELTEDMSGANLSDDEDIPPSFKGAMDSIEKLLLSKE